LYIIGAGLSGLTIADYYLNKKNVVVMEKNDFLGGRIKTLHSASSSFEIGSQFFCKSDSNFRKLIDKKKLNEDVIPLDFSDISFYSDGKLFMDNNQIISVIQSILEYQNSINENEYFDDWFLKHFDKDALFIPKGIIRAITFSDSSTVLAYYAKYILETFFEECYTFKNGLEEIISALAQNVTIERTMVKQCIIQNNKLVGIDTDNRYIDTTNDLVVSTAPPGQIQFNDSSELDTIFQDIHYNGCIVNFFKIDSIFSDLPRYIFFSEENYKISVIEQFEIGTNSFIGCLLPYQNKSFDKDKVITESLTFIGNIFGKTIKEKILDTFYYDWKWGMPQVDGSYVKAVKKLKTVDIENLRFAGDYCTLYPSMDSAVKSGFDIIKELSNLLLE
jgi:protoporphyrinogen oxidase